MVLGLGGAIGWARTKRLLENKDHSVRDAPWNLCSALFRGCKDLQIKIYIYTDYLQLLYYIHLNLHLKKICSFCKSILSFNMKLIIGQLHSLHALEIRLKFCKIFFTYFKEYIQDSKWTYIELPIIFLIHSHSEITGLLKKVFKSAEKHQFERLQQFTLRWFLAIKKEKDYSSSVRKLKSSVKVLKYEGFTSLRQARLLWDIWIRFTGQLPFAR